MPESILSLPYPARIRLIAPAGRAYDVAAMWRGIERLEAAGATVEQPTLIDRVDLRFAGSDAERAEDINALARLVRLPDVALAIRGGYGSVRLLEQLDYHALGERLQGSALALMGYSDFTALQLALYARCSLVSFSGPMLGHDFGAPTLSRLSWNHCWQTLSSPSSSISWSLRTPPARDTFETEGTLWGGSLAILCSLLGTPYFPQIDDGILVLEDVGESPYRLERMLYQLHLAGILRRQRALILGDFIDCRAGSQDQACGYDLAVVFAHLRELVNVPVLDGLAFGHDVDKYTLAFGAPARLRLEGTQAQLCFNAYPYRLPSTLRSVRETP